MSKIINKLFPTGAKIRFKNKPGLYHVRGFVDDQILVRRWVPTRHRWHYESYTYGVLETLYYQGHLTIEK